MQYGALKKMFDTAKADNGDPTVISHLLPDLMRANDKVRLYKLAALYKKGKEAWLPEMLTLLNTRSFSLVEKKRFLKRIFGREISDFIQGKKIGAMMADSCARIGRIGFSFPQWRFVSQGFNQASLLERYGYTKLNRDTDVRDEALPKSNPARDEYGTGFVDHDGEWTVEYRRAYILCSRQSEDNQATVIIRNNSYFFGRDRLPQPAYISTERFSQDDLKNLGKDDFESGRFVPLQDFLKGDVELTTKIKILSELLDHFDKADSDLSKWLSKGQGLRDLIGFADFSLERMAKGNDKPPFYLAVVDNRNPPWFPSRTLPISPETVQSMRDFADGKGSYRYGHSLHSIFSHARYDQTKMVLLSGPTGDLPVKPGFSLT